MYIGSHRAPSKGRSKYLIVMLVVGMFVALAVPAVAAPLPKVDVCHYADGTFHLINISQNAFQAHVDHGDASPFEPVPGMANYEFDAACGVRSTEVAEGAFSKSGLEVAFTVYQAYNSDYSGVASYSYTGNGNVMTSTVSDACLDDTGLTASVWGPGTSSLLGSGFMIYTLVDDGGGFMSLRALFRADEAAAKTVFATQCLTSSIGASGGTGFLTFLP